MAFLANRNVEAAIDEGQTRLRSCHATLLLADRDGKLSDAVKQSQQGCRITPRILTSVALIFGQCDLHGITFRGERCAKAPSE